MWRLVNRWVAELDQAPWRAPSTPFPELSQPPHFEYRTAEITGSDGIEVFYRREFDGEVVDLVWVGRVGDGGPPPIGNIKAHRTEAALHQIEVRCMSASKAPWEAFLFTNPNDQSFIRIGGLDDDQPDMHLRQSIGGRHLPASDADVDFVAHARQDIPALIAEVRRLRARLEHGGEEGASTR